MICENLLRVFTFHVWRSHVSRFHARFTLTSIPGSPAFWAGRVAAPEVPAAQPTTLLLVDDNPTFLRILSDFLGEEESILLVGTAGSREEALEKAKELRPQVILLDLVMPGLGGLSAIRRLRRLAGVPTLVQFLLKHLP